MKLPDPPKSELTRAGVTILAVWIFLAVTFVLFNRYRYGSNFDSITDLILLALVVPAALGALGTASWAAGRRISLVLLTLMLTGISAVAGWNAYQSNERAKEREKAAQAAEVLRSERFKQLENKFGARCASEKRRAKLGRENSYAYCLWLGEEEVRESQKAK